MADLTDIDLDDLAMTLADQSQPYGDFLTLIDRATGELKIQANGGGEENEDEIDDQSGLIQVDPIPAAVWYEDMVDFVAGINDEQAARRLGRALDGRGAFRRFRDQLHRGDPALLSLLARLLRHPRPTPRGGMARRERHRSAGRG